MDIEYFIIIIEGFHSIAKRREILGIIVLKMVIKQVGCRVLAIRKPFAAKRSAKNLIQRVKGSPFTLRGKTEKQN